MHLFSPDRPESSPSSPALLLDGSAVPYFSVRPKANGLIGLSAMLRDYDATAAFSYSYRHIEMPPETLGVFMERYAEDPEGVLLEFFGWAPQSGRKPSELKPLKVELSAEAKTNLDEMLSIL